MAVTLQQRINEGDEARRLLADDGFLAHVIEKLEREYIEGWRATAANDIALRESFYNRLHVLIDVRNGIQRIALDGRMAEREADRMRREEANG